MFFALLLGTSSEAQFFKKLKKKAEKAAQQTVEDRVAEETSKKTDQALDSILEPGSGGKQAPDTQGNGNTTGTSSESTTSTGSVATGPKTIQVYSKFDFVPGDKPLFYDDFNDEFMGDFPSKWNTNGSGEVVTVGSLPGKWYSVASRSLTVPNLGTTLPEDFTMEFDLKVVNLSRNTGRCSCVIDSTSKRFQISARHCCRYSYRICIFTFKIETQSAVTNTADGSRCLSVG